MSHQLVSPAPLSTSSMQEQYRVWRCEGHDVRGRCFSVPTTSECEEFRQIWLQQVPTTQPAFIEWDSTICRFPPPFQNFGAKRQKQHLRWLCEPPMKIDLQEKDLTYIWLQVKALLTLLNWDVARFLLVLRDSVSKVLACWSTVTRQRDNPPLDFVLEVELYLQLRFSSLFALECPERSLSKLHHEPFNSQVQKIHCCWAYWNRAR